MALSMNIQKSKNLRTFSFRPERAGKLLGEEIAAQKMESIFSSLNIGVNKLTHHGSLLLQAGASISNKRSMQIEEIAG